MPLKLRIVAILALLSVAACQKNEARVTGCARNDDDVAIPAGVATLGSTRFQPEERPVRRAYVAAFRIDRHEVTNRQFGAFVAATGYRTGAEQGGGGVFHQPTHLRDLTDMSQWWLIDRTANWRYPHGRPGPSARPDEPVVQVSIADALAYARWAGRALPTEDEWEWAARGGLKSADYTWGNARGSPKAANYWQGPFPLADSGGDGYRSVAPVGCFPANGYGLFDMAGNVWEITQTRWGPRGSTTPSHVIKGGSWLCADNYCLRYRPAARQAADDSFSTDHIGFRTVSRSP